MKPSPGGVQMRMREGGRKGGREGGREGGSAHLRIDLSRIVDVKHHRDET